MVSGSAMMEKRPSMSVIVPLVVPFAETLTPASGSPFSSVTIPVIRTVRCWMTGMDSELFFIRTILFPRIAYTMSVFLNIVRRISATVLFCALTDI